MDYFLIIVLGIVVLSVWNSSRDANERMRDAVNRLERELDFLRSQLAALVRANAKSGESVAQSAPAQPSGVEAAPKAATPAAAQAAHSAPPPIAAFTPVATPKPVEPVVPVPAPPSPQPTAPPQAAAVPPAQKPPVQSPVFAAIPPATSDLPTAKQAEPQIPPAKPPEPVRQASAPPAPPVHAAAAFQGAPAAAAKEPAPAAQPFSLEQTLGANWLNKIGIASVVIGIAFWLANRLQAWGPGGKVLCGFAVSLVLLGGGVWLERKPTYRIFARGGIGGGWALAYFTTFAMYHLQAARIVDSLPFDLVLMMLVAAGMVGHSLRYKSQTVTALAFMLGFATLLTSHVEEPNQTVVFSLAASAILAIALVVVTTIRHWAVLEFCGLIAVYVSHLVWLTKVLPDNHADFAEFWPSTALILLYWLIFRLAYVLRTPLDKREENLSSVSAIVNSGGVLGLLKFQSAHPEWAFWALVALGAFEMGLAWWAKEKRRQAFVVLSTISVVLLVSSVPFRFHGVSWPVLWLVQAQVLAIAGLRLGEPVFRRLGLLTGVITGGVLALHDVMPLAIERVMAGDTSRHWSLTVGLALAAILYWTHAEVYPRRWPEIAANALESLALKLSSWLALGAAATCLWVVLPERWLAFGWLALFLVLVFAGHRFRATMPLVEGDVLALGAAGLLVFDHVLPLAYFRLSNADLGHHPVDTSVLAFAALAYWLRSEVFPRVLPQLDEPGSPAKTLAGWHAFILPCASWLGLGAATAALWVWMPDQWLPLGWIALFLVLVIVGHRFKATMLPLEGDILALLSAGVLAFHHVLPLVWLRFQNPDSARHPALTTVLVVAALAFWSRAELLPRFLPRLTASPIWDPAAWEAVMLPLASYIGTALASAALWVALPPEWVAVGWLALVVALGLVADGIAGKALALQADVLALVSVLALAARWDLQRGDWHYRTPLLVAVALLYSGMRRKTILSGLNYVPAAYSWAAAYFLVALAFDIFNPPWVAPVVVALALALFEVGRFARKGFLRWQGHTLFAVAVLLSTGADPSTRLYDHFSLIHSCLLEVMILAAGGYWLYERTRITDRCVPREHIVGIIADLVGTFSIALWFVDRFPLYWTAPANGAAWIAAIWAAMATALMALAWVMRRRTFLVQAVALAVAVVLRGLLFDLFAESRGDFWHGTLFHLSVAALVLVAALPFAFKVRGPEFWAGGSFKLPEPFVGLLSKPDQWFFFAPFGLMVVALAVKLSSGHITIAWSLLGLGTFLFALVVGERSFRLAGLGLLLVSVAKILLMDVWALAPPDRYVTLIVLGTALLAVSFLYTRFSEKIRKYL
ncbi:MAG: DUF2339 domain-containing protein [Terracidiphilus sp.]